MIDLATEVFEPEVLVNGSPAAQLHVVNVERSFGAGRLDTATLTFDLEREGDILNNIDLSSMVTLGDEIEVRAGSRIIHWGRVAQVRPQIGGDGIALAVISRCEHHHFGVPIIGREVLSRSHSGGAMPGTVHRPLVFNPSRDGLTVPTMSKHKAKESDYHLFVDEEGNYTSESLGHQKEETDLDEQTPWTLPEIVLYLCGTGNPDETFIKNPTRDEVEETFGTGTEAKHRPRPGRDPKGGKEDLVKDLELPDGQYLAPLLDLTLEAYGYRWYVDYISQGERKIRIGKKGEGTQKQVGHQPAGYNLDPSKTIVEQVDLTYDAVGRGFNRLTVLGGYYEVETTVELVRAWTESDDSYHQDELPLTADDKHGTTVNADNINVWRKWVLNEAGDYNGLRTDITGAHDFSNLGNSNKFFTNDLACRRRRFWPCLTLDSNEDGPRGNFTEAGISVEFSIDGGASWANTNTLLDGSLHLLDNECGIYFHENLPPGEIVGAGDDARVRVTACIRSDKRIEHTETAAASISPDVIHEVLVLPDKFQHRKVHSSSRFESFVRAKTMTAAERIDTGPIQYFCKELLAAWNQAECSGQLVLTGIDHDYNLGELITGITGREIGFAVDADGTKFPQIVGISYNVANMTMALILEAFRDEV